MTLPTSQRSCFLRAKTIPQYIKNKKASFTHYTQHMSSALPFFPIPLQKVMTLKKKIRHCLCLAYTAYAENSNDHSCGQWWRQARETKKWLHRSCSRALGLFCKELPPPHQKLHWKLRDNSKVICKTSYERGDLPLQAYSLRGRTGAQRIPGSFLLTPFKNKIQKFLWVDARPWMFLKQLFTHILANDS